MNLFWRLVFAWKKLTGWIDLGEVVTATGIVVELPSVDLDGDRTFSLYLDPGQDRLITGFGGRLTTPTPELGPALHCEVEPWAPESLLAAYATLEVGDHVSVTGAWGFDGVHTGRALWIEILLAVLRHGPNVNHGWFEIHEVYSISR